MNSSCHSFTSVMLRVVLIAFIVSISSNDTIDPECYMTVPEVARYFGYPSEIHLVRTEDDFILELHRIQSRKNLSTLFSRTQPVVFLQHGILADGFNWASNMPNQSAGFVFADAGFDIWIANSRGTPPSQKHIGYGPKDDRFWNFTWQDMSSYDLTDSINYVLKETGQKSLYYIGHSQGTVIMFAKLAEDPQFGKKIRQFHALAPVATVSHIGGLFRLFKEKLVDIVQFILHRVPNAPLEIPKLIQKAISFFCSLPVASGICTIDIGFLDGTEKMFNETRVGVYLCHFPAATSSKNILHWTQIVKAQRFQKFDYGEKGNLIEYGQKTPPQYNLSRIRTPTFLYWSEDDILADTQDIRDTIWANMNKTIEGNTELPDYTHLDFVLGVNASDDVYKPIIREIKKDFSKINH